jgi:hypothetical protein
MVWVVQDRSTAAALPMAAAPLEVGQVPPAAEEQSIVTAAPVAVHASGAEPVAAAVPQAKAAPRVSIDSSGAATYVARDGDTVSQLAVALLGSDSKQHRDAIVAENVSLQSNPDRVLTGQAYSVGTRPAARAASDVDDQRLDGSATSAAVTAGAPEGATVQKAVPTDKPHVAAAPTGPKLMYTAQTGDTVRALASDLLGGDTKVNRDAIIDGNASLQADPDRMLVGKRYTIAAPDGLSADPTATRAKGPTTQPGADEVARLSGGRSLRYTAVVGDTVAKLAMTLLGSDTPANRDLIIQTNPSLKLDPDHLSEGQTYWIPAPTATPAR